MTKYLTVLVNWQDAKGQWYYVHDPCETFGWREKEKAQERANVVKATLTGHNYPPERCLRKRFGIPCDQPLYHLTIKPILITHLD